MLCDRHAKRCAHGEGLAHDLCVHHRQAIVGEAASAGLDQHRHFGEFLALLAFGDGGVGADIDVARFNRALLQEGEYGDVVDHGFGVGHGGNGGDAATGSGHRAGLNRFFVFLTRLAEMHLDIEQAGAEHIAAAIDHLGAVGRFSIVEKLCAKIRDGVADGEQASHFIHAGFRVDQARVGIGDFFIVEFAGGFGELGHTHSLSNRISLIGWRKKLRCIALCIF